MSAQPDHAPVTPHAPAPGAPAELLAQLRADRRAAQWVPAFEQEWAAALEESRRTFSLAGLCEVVQVWQGRLASAPAVDAFVASGYDNSAFIVEAAVADFAALQAGEVPGPRPAAPDRAPL
ncbi:DUF6247 family protein [Streptomyces triculaminicus]|uniref:DUF6247 family protein n=1 Tax=Streptomyces triculaminicus TaxID=2816232 RepID=UPI0033C3821B